jgi:adenine-specific DNA-methyltransferase
MYYAITAPDGTEVYPTGPTGYESRWRVGRQTYEKMVTDNLVEWKNVKGIWTPYYKFHLEGRQKRLSNWWGDIEGNKKASIDVKGLLGERVFETPKPIELIARAAKLANTENKDIVLDFFSGSGTTAHSIMKLNADDGGQRHHIQVQLPEPTDNMSEAIKAGYKTVADISKERIRRAGEKIKVDYSDKLTERESPLDVGFKVFKLADTNFTKWKTSSETDDDKLQQHLLTMRDSSNDSATEEELLTELLIKLGVSLTTKIESETIDDLNIWRVGDNLILGYLNEHVKPSLEQLRKIADIKPTKLIILEDAFQGDDELKTNLSQICKTNKIELWTV